MLTAPLALTPLIDVALSVVFVLLPVHRASGECGCARRGPELPTAERGWDLEIGPVLTVDRRAVTLDGRWVADTSEIEGPVGDGALARLEDQLAITREVWTELHPGEPFPGAVVVEAARDLDVRVIRRALRASARAGYGRVDLVVRLRE